MKNEGESNSELNPTTGAELRQVYSSEEVSEIIRVALTNVENGGRATVNQSEMLTIAEEFGLSPEDLVRASETIDASRDHSARHTAVKNGFIINLVAYCVGVVGLFLLNAFISPEFWWFVLAAIAYGSVLAVHGFMAKFMPDLTYDTLHATEEESNESHAPSGSSASVGRSY